MRINRGKVNDLLIRLCWDDADLARAMGISSSALLHNFRQSRVRKSIIGKMANALDVDYK